MPKLFFLRRSSAKKGEKLSLKTKMGFQDLLFHVETGGSDPNIVLTKKASYFIKKLLPNDADIDLLKKAYNYSKEKHQHQKRASGEPYFIHLFETARILADYGMDSQTIAAALLHDVLEDTNVKDEEFKKEFNEPIYTIVKNLTKIDTLSKERKKMSNEEYMRNIIKSSNNDIRVILIKLADKLHNMRTLSHLKAIKRITTAKQTLEVYVPMADKLGLTEIRDELGHICMNTIYPKETKSLQTKLLKKKELKREEIKEMTQILKNKLSKSRRKADLEILDRCRYTVWSKMKRTKKSLDQMYDYSYLQIITSNEKDCYKILELVHSSFFPIPKKLKDYMSTSKNISMQGIHTSVISPSGNPVKVYIKSKYQNYIAHKGVYYWFETGQHEKIKEVFEELGNLRKQEFKDEKEFMKTLRTDFLEKKTFIFFDSKLYLIPEKATVLDFAYKKYPKKAHTLAWIKINGQKKPLWHELEAGDIVNMKFYTKQTITPEWLDYVYSYSAKNLIEKKINKLKSNYLKKENGITNLKITGNIAYVEKLIAILNVKKSQIKFLRIEKGIDEDEFTFEIVLSAKLPMLEKLKEKLSKSNQVKNVEFWFSFDKKGRLRR